MNTRHWCMCTKLEAVARDGHSTCSICGGRDAYGLATDRPIKLFKKVEFPNISTRTEFNEDLNFCRVFELPDEYPKGFCVAGPHAVTFQMVDWFSPIPYFDLPSFGGTIRPWKEYESLLKELLHIRQTNKPGKKYLLITDFNESFIFEKKQ